MNVDLQEIRSLLEVEIINFKDLSLSVNSIAILLIIYVIGVLFLKFFKRLMRRIQEKKDIDISQIYALYKVLKYLFIFIFLLYCLDTAGFNLNVLLAGSAALLVGIGFGLQNLYLDFFSGIILLFDGTIAVGDIIEVDGLVGRIDQIDFRTSKITTRSNTNIIIPNSKLTNDNVINWTRNKKATRFEVQVSVAYGTPPRKVEKILTDIAQEHPNISKRHAPKVQFKHFGDSGLDFRLFFWTSEMFRIEFIKSEIRFQIEEEFNKHHITIPFPQRDVHIIRSTPKK